ncbi:LPS-assembly protein LptD [Bordetella sp. N]|uniref:LPS-assembly protein LptD n=1 Tax=Bordetella sp. N TaxID=1746199 RepID=UPI000709A13F|nr:LPS biosynthesis protein [Bordetella sp. N]
MRMVRWSILILAGAAAAAQAQVPADSSVNDWSKTASKSMGKQNAKAKPPKAAQPAANSVQVMGLKDSTGLRSSTGLRRHQVDGDNLAGYMQADNIDGDPDSNVTLTGNAEVRRMDTIIKGDTVKYRRAEGVATSEGHARLLRDGSLAIGPAMSYNVDTNTGALTKPDFWLGATGGRAQAEHADLFSRSTMRLNQVTYTACSCDNPAWYIKASSIDLDFDENEGMARNGVLYFKDTPILAWPYMTFPVKKERKSGFLAPTYGTTSRSGFDLQVPYYFNLAPNYDLTLTPRVLSKRGEQLGAEFRYLGPTYTGTLMGTYLSSDRTTGESRYLYSTKHFQNLGNGFYTSWNISGVSDGDYFRDFTSIGVNDAAQTYLPRQGMVGWNNQYWQSYVQVYKYQTLQDPDAPILPPYDKVPELSLSGQRYDLNGFDLEYTSTATRFSRPIFQDTHNGPDGDRLQMYPTLAYPIVRPGWYITPKVGLNFTQYQNTNWHPGDNSGFGAGAYDYRSSASRTLPIMSLDAGMTFERDTTLFGKSSIQTLEPRLFYLRVPYRDQSKMPVYDTSLSDFSFSQAFEENIYNGGWDRIANANQLTAALTTRWLDADTGFERASLAAGQQFYFEDQKVTLPNELPRSDVRSAYLVAATAALTDTLSTTVEGQWNPYDSRWSRGLVSARWSPQRATSVSLSYRYTRDPQTTTGYTNYQPAGQNQISLAFQWPFTSRWSGVGRVDYSMRGGDGVVDPYTGEPAQRRVTQAIAGVEYKGDCCWTGRFVFQRYAVSTTDVNNAFFFQLELTGLGSLGTDPLKLMKKNIPGYEQTTPPVQPGTSFERYE